MNTLYNPHPDKRPDKKQRRQLIKAKDGGNTLTQLDYPANQLARYGFAEQDVRGEMVQLTSSYQSLIKGHQYHPAVQRLVK